MVNLNPLLPLVDIFYQGERGGVEVKHGGVEAQRSKNGGERKCYHLGGDKVET
jgi:hypothetical protein